MHRFDVAGDKLDGNARMPSRESVDNPRGEPCGQRVDASDTDIAGRRIGEGFDLSHALPQLIERGKPMSEHRMTVCGRFDTLSAALKETHAQRMLHIRNRLLHHRMLDRMLCCSFRHTVILRDGVQYVHYS